MTGELEGRAEELKTYRGSLLPSPMFPNEARGLYNSGANTAPSCRFVQPHPDRLPPNPGDSYVHKRRLCITHKGIVFPLKTDYVHLSF